MPTLIGTDVAANYLVIKQSPGAALSGLDASGAYPLLTFSTPNLRLFKVVITGEDLTATPAAANSSWSKVVRAVQVTSEVFAIFAPSVTEGDSTFCFLAPDFNTNPGTTTGDAVTGTQTFSILETAITDAVGGSCTVTRASLVGVAVA
jgi:hypothetical protein